MTEDYKQINDIANRFSGDLQEAIASGSKEEVYVLVNALGMVKVGVSADPNRRVSNIETASGITTVKVLSMPSDNARKTEKLLLDAFDRYRVRGEWLKAPTGLETQLLGAVLSFAVFQAEGLVEMAKHKYETINSSLIPESRYQDAVAITEIFSLFGWSKKVDIDILLDTGVCSELIRYDHKDKEWTQALAYLCVQQDIDWLYTKHLQDDRDEMNERNRVELRDKTLESLKTSWRY